MDPKKNIDLIDPGLNPMVSRVYQTLQETDHHITIGFGPCLTV